MRFRPQPTVSRTVAIAAIDNHTVKLNTLASSSPCANAPDCLASSSSIALPVRYY
jgi:hypothetical protein